MSTTGLNDAPDMIAKNSRQLSGQSITIVRKDR